MGGEEREEARGWGLNEGRIKLYGRRMSDDKGGYRNAESGMQQHHANTKYCSMAMDAGSSAFCDQHVVFRRHNDTWRDLEQSDGPPTVDSSPGLHRRQIILVLAAITIHWTCVLQSLLGAQAATMLRRLQASRLSVLSRGRRHVASLSQALARHAPVDVHPEVQEALQNHGPVVALETTIVTHGMPYPTNLETAQSVEKMVRDQGAIPATIGIIGGRVKIGLEPEQLAYLANVENDPPAVKISRRDIAAAIATKRDGGTTCSATLIFAAMAGIKVRGDINRLTVKDLFTLPLGLCYRRVSVAPRSSKSFC